MLVLVVPTPAGEAAVVLIERASGGRHHSGEISFPGGRAEAGDDDLAATAIREAAEEIGLDAVAADVRVAGTLEPFWIPVSNFRVTPVVAIAGRPPALSASPDEVAAIVEAPLVGVPARRPDRDRRAGSRRVADPLRRLPDRRAPRLGRDRPDPRPARRDPRLTPSVDRSLTDRQPTANGRSQP